MLSIRGNDLISRYIYKTIQFKFNSTKHRTQKGLASKGLGTKRPASKGLTKGPEYKRSGILQKTLQKRPGCKIFWTFVFKYPCRMFCSQTHKASGLKRSADYRYGYKRCGHKRSGIRKGRSLQGLAMHKKRKAMDRGREIKEQRTGDEGTIDRRSGIGQQKKEQ